MATRARLWGNAMTWWDHDTGSVWSQPLGEAIIGPHKGERLELLTSSFTTWDEWSQAHPGTLALDAPNGNIGRDLSDLSIVVEIGDESVAFPIPTVRQVGVVNSEVAGVPVAILADPESDDWVVFARTLDSRVVELDLVEGRLVEEGGTAAFDATLGIALEGDESLLRLPAFTSFPDDYPTFFPNGAVWTPTGLVPVT